jgi:hypothetical protein
MTVLFAATQRMDKMNRIAYSLRWKNAFLRNDKGENLF